VPGLRTDEPRTRNLTYCICLIYTVACGPRRKETLVAINLGGQSPCALYQQIVDGLKKEVSEDVCRRARRSVFVGLQKSCWSA
jgi:hypothetical protein